MKWLGPKPEGEWRDLALDNAVVRFLVSGDGPPVILLHGLSASVRWWARNIGALSKHFTVYALDLLEYERDFGRRRFALREASRRIVQWMECLEIGRATLIGHSMGGAIAAEIAADAPGKIEKLVLVNAAALFPRSGLPLSPTQLVVKAPHFSPTLVPVLLHDAWRTGPRLLLTAAWDLITGSVRHKLPRITAQTLIVWGEHDGILSPALGKELRSLIPASRLTVIPRAGHNPMWEQPEAFNAAVLEFLRGD